MTTALILAIGALVVVVLILAALPRPLWVLRVDGEGITVVKGDAPRRFVHAAQSTLEDQSLDGSTIKAYRHLGRVRLIFSRNVSVLAQQRFRNIWNAEKY